jgi:PAS domain S-box-containing protein
MPLDYSKSNQASVLLFKQAFAHASVGLALVALDGHFIYTNHAYAELTGYPIDELRNLTIGKLMHPEDAKSNAILKAQMLEGQIPGYVIEKRYLRKDGSHRWVKSSISLGTNRAGRPAYIVGVTEDIDERHKAEEALRESEAQFRFMAEYMPPKVFTATAGGVLDYFSPQWASYTGLSMEEMGLSGWTNVLHPSDKDENLRRWQLSIRTGRPYYIENRLRRIDGEFRWHLTTAYAMHDADGNIIKWIGCATDIHELRQSRGLKARLQVLAKQREQLITTNRSKDEFIMLASHQLRTPASGVKQFVGMVIQGYVGKVPRKQLEILQRAYDCNERQLKITDDLLKVARIDTGQVSLNKSPCNAIELVKNVIAEEESTFKSRHQNVVFNSRHQKVLMIVDTKLIYMVLENLLDNASKYSTEGATITITIRKGKDWISVSIKDSGVGIAQEDREKLFQKFSRIDNPLSDTVGGSGLGLYLAKKIIELHQGVLGVSSTIGQGSTFTLRLPRKID